MDLISCRNLLIYLDAETQAKLIPLFNFALNPGGYLFLGKSEGVAARTTCSNGLRKARLYRRLAAGPPDRSGFPDSSRQGRGHRRSRRPVRPPGSGSYAD